MSEKKEVRSLYKSEHGKEGYRLTRAPEAAPFWEGCKDGRLMLPKCKSCGKVHFYPRPFCPHCDGRDLEWMRASGEGAVYSYAVVRQPLEKAFSDLLPYIIAVVELKEGVRMLSHVAGADPEKVACGMKVAVDFQAMPVGVTVPVFRPA